MNKIKSKKGDVFQIFFIIIILFVVAIVGILVATLAGNITRTIGNLPVMNQTPNAKLMNDKVGSYTIPTVDFFVFFIFLFGNISLIIASTRTGFSPTLIFLFIILFFFAIIIGAGFVNIYQGFASTDTLSGTAQGLTLTGVIFSKYFPLFVTVISGVIIIIMYGKSGSDIVP